MISGDRAVRNALKRERHHVLVGASSAVSALAASSNVVGAAPVLRPGPRLQRVLNVVTAPSRAVSAYASGPGWHGVSRQAGRGVEWLMHFVVPGWSGAAGRVTTQVLRMRGPFLVGSAALAGAILGFASGLVSGVPGVRSGVMGPGEIAKDSAKKACRAGLAVAMGTAAGLLIPWAHPVATVARVGVAAGLGYYFGGSEAFVRSGKSFVVSERVLRVAITRAARHLGATKIRWADDGQRVRAHFPRGGRHPATVMDIRMNGGDVVAKSFNEGAFSRFDHGACAANISEMLRLIGILATEYAR